MKRDIRDSGLYQEIETLFGAIHHPASGQISDAADAHVSSDGRRVVFSGTLLDRLEGGAPTRICGTDLASGDTRVLTFGPNTDRLPRFSPDGACVAFLSDRRRAGDFQLYLLDPNTGAARPTPAVDGWVEYFHWSPDGKRIVLGVAGHGADVAGGQGATATRQHGAEVLSWMPTVDTAQEDYRWRRAWVYDLATHSVRQVGNPNTNVWEVAWYGNDALAAVVSSGPTEGHWYTARLRKNDLRTGEAREIYAPRDQLGWPAASPSGKYLAIVEAICSDRWFVAGELRVIEDASGQVRSVETDGVDITYAEWRSEQHLLLAGHRGFETVVGVYDAVGGFFKQVWASKEITTGGRYTTVSGFGDPGECVLIGESYFRAPELATIRRGRYSSVRSFDLGYADHAAAVHSLEPLSWQAPDGLRIDGWLARPRANPPPYPLVTNIHGGPVYHWRPRWPARTASGVTDLVLLKKGYAIFYPNPRGSSGRGQGFAREVLGELGGAETSDHLSGLDMLISRGVADPARLGVIGVSHGGFMTSWLITQDNRFAAAVSVSPITNYVTEQLISNIPDFVSLFLTDHYSHSNGKYFQRSPVMHAHKARTPTLNICGALDRCTPPEEAVQFHNALLQSGTKSVLVTYPQEGHGVRKLPAAIDYATRVIAWFAEHMPA